MFLSDHVLLHAHTSATTISLSLPSFSLSSIPYPFTKHLLFLLCSHSSTMKKILLHFPDFSFLSQYCFNDYLHQLISFLYPPHCVCISSNYIIFTFPLCKNHSSYLSSVSFFSSFNFHLTFLSAINTSCLLALNTKVPLLK